jgi:large subunit ribosomal protein L22
MESRARLRWAGIPATKMRAVADLVRGKDVDIALHTLQFVTRAAAVPMRKLIQSATANAREKATAEDRRFDADRMFVKSVAVDEGPTQKRWRPRAQGRAYRIRKRSCHVLLILDEHPDGVARAPRPAARAEAAAPAAPAKGKGKPEGKGKSKGKSAAAKKKSATAGKGKGKEKEKSKGGARKHAGAGRKKKTAGAAAT